MTRIPGLAIVPLLSLTAMSCVPPGHSNKSSSSESSPTATTATAVPSAHAIPAAPHYQPSLDIMTSVFEDTFDNTAVAVAVPGAAADAGNRSHPAAHDAGAAPPVATLPPRTELGPNWTQAGTDVWHIENGMVCGERAHNHGLWLNRTLPVNARIEFDAISGSPEGDLKAEVWGDGMSSAHSVSYTDATSYLTILGGWKNSLNVLARIDEHGRDRKFTTLDPFSADPRMRPVVPGERYHFMIERNDRMTVHWSVNGVEFLSFRDMAPLAGLGHDHFAFNDWEVKVCFDNVKVTPLP